MSKGVKIFLIVVAVLVVLGAAGFTYGKSIWNNISFSAPKINIQKTIADLQGFDLSQGQLPATLQMNVKNNNSFSIPFSSLNVKLYYNGNVISESSESLTQKMIVPANGNLTVSDTITIYLSKATENLIIQKALGNKVKIDYKVFARIFGIPIPASLQTQSIEV